MPDETHPGDEVPESVYDDEGREQEPDAPVGQAEPDAAEPEVPDDVDLPTTSTDPPAAS